MFDWLRMKSRAEVSSPDQVVVLVDVPALVGEDLDLAVVLFPHELKVKTRAKFRYKIMTMAIAHLNVSSVDDGDVLSLHEEFEETGEASLSRRVAGEAGQHAEQLSRLGGQKRVQRRNIIGESENNPST